MCIDQTILIKQCVTSLWLSATTNIYKYGSKSCNNKLYSRQGVIMYNNLCALIAAMYTCRHLLTQQQLRTACNSNYLQQQCYFQLQ